MTHEEIRFNQFMRRVDAWLDQLLGMSSADLPHFDYRSAFDDSVDPRDVAQDVLELVLE